MKKRLGLIYLFSLACCQTIVGASLFTSCGSNASKDDQQGGGQDDQGGQDDHGKQDGQTKRVVNLQCESANTLVDNTWCTISNETISAESGDDERIDVQIKDEYATEWAFYSISYSFEGSSDEATIVYKDSDWGEGSRDYGSQPITNKSFTIVSKDIAEETPIIVKVYISRQFKVNLILDKDGLGIMRGRETNFVVVKEINEINLTWMINNWTSDTIKKYYANLQTENDAFGCSANPITSSTTSIRLSVNLTIKASFIDKLQDNTLVVNVGYTA